MGLLGVVAALVGQSFALTQRSFWLAFGLAYVGLGALYLTDRVSPLMIRIGGRSGTSTGSRNVVVLGVILGLGIPACAAPLLFAASGVALGSGTVVKAFFAMTLFGLALSAPLLALIAVPRTAVLLQWAHARGRWLRLFVGWLLVAAGLWGVWFGLFVDPTQWR
jgi:cytochrome c-type biogenesis protein